MGEIKKKKKSWQNTLIKWNCLGEKTNEYSLIWSNKVGIMVCICTLFILSMTSTSNLNLSIFLLLDDAANIPKINSEWVIIITSFSLSCKICLSSLYYSCLTKGTNNK